ncbi:hypothetical protein PT273_06080 [Orbaceae bacterium ESL0727]|nr:hypothetical protein [Orbaceae bacterium ESL0727]
MKILHTMKFFNTMKVVKTAAITLTCVVFSMSLIGCSGKSTKAQPKANANAQQKDNTPRWSKPHGVLEGCDGVMSNSQQCETNPNNKQYMIQIDRIGGE